MIFSGKALRLCSRVYLELPEIMWDVDTGIIIIMINLLPKKSYTLLLESVNIKDDKKYVNIYKLSS